MNDKQVFAIVVIIAAVAVIAAVALYDNNDESTEKVHVEVYEEDGIPVVYVKGGISSDCFPSINLETTTDLANWVKNNVTEGKPLPLFVGEACSAYSYTTSSNTFVGRNSDFNEKANCPVVVYYEPTNGYKSIGLFPKVSIFELNETLEEMKNDIRARAAPFMMNDGMNEKGLVCAHLAVNNAESSKTDDGAMFSICMMRYILDHAATVDEAKDIIEKYGYSSYLSVGGWFSLCTHLFIADSEGNTLIVELVDGKLYFTTGDNAKILTNHYITEAGSETPILPGSTYRYNVIKEELAKLTEEATISDCMEILHKAKTVRDNERTIWSEIFDTAGKTITVCYNENYEKQYVYKFSDFLN